MPAGGHTFISLSPKKHRLPEGAFLYKWKTFVKFRALLICSKDHCTPNLIIKQV